MINSQLGRQSGCFHKGEKMTNRKTMILTGASRGIGHATVKKFSAEGWEVLTCSRDDIPRECQRDPNWSYHVPVDLAHAQSVEDFIEKALNFLGGRPLHALVNNAAMSPKLPHNVRLGCFNGNIDDWRHVFELNFFAPLALARGFADSLKKEKGTIVNITSIAGHEIHPFAGSPYSVSKAALSSLTRELAAELAPFGIRVNAIAPGEIATDMIGPEYEMLLERIPMRRFGKAEEVASAVFNLCSDEFAYVTGSEIFVTGGQHL